MAEILNLKHEDMVKFEDTLDKVLKDLESTEDAGAKAIVGLLAMDEDSFNVLSPGVLQSFQQELAKPSEQIILTQALNAAGVYAEDLEKATEALQKDLDESVLSRAKREFLENMILTMRNALTSSEGIAKRLISVDIELCDPRAKMPEYAHLSDSGMDVYALEDVTIGPGEAALVSTGLKFALPVGYEIQVRPKSGIALRTKLRIANTPGTIDQGYRDELKVIVENLEPKIKDFIVLRDDEGRFVDTEPVYGASYTIGAGQKFCQIVLAEVPKIAWHEVKSVKDIGEDRGGGFGSTGLK